MKVRDLEQKNKARVWIASVAQPVRMYTHAHSDEDIVPYRPPSCTFQAAHLLDGCASENFQISAARVGLIGLVDGMLCSF